jgi:plasmanylethanolamine desaturase
MQTLSPEVSRSISPARRVRPKAVVMAEVLGAVLWTVLCFLLLLRAAGAPVTSPYRAVFICVAIFFGILLADFGSGFFHWFFDTFFEETTPFFGPYVISSFREHHRDPLAMTHHGFFELTGNSCLGFLPCMTAVWWFGPVEPQTEFGVFNYSWWLSFTVTLTATNQLHCWAHQAAPPWIARALQRLGLGISRAHHARHHAPPHRSAYCITNGWTNGFADRFSVFARVERVFVALGVPVSKVR